MKQLYILLFLLTALKGFGATRYWDGGGGDGLWATATNWMGDVAPVAADDVVLDNLNGVPGTYTVTLPNTLVTVKSITITPASANNITLTLPSTNTLQPGLSLTGPGNVLVLDNGGIFRNSTGSPNSSPQAIDISTTDSIRINNGGRYVHNTARGHAYLVDQLSTAPGTEKGIFEFDMPVTGASAISLTGSNYGTLVLSAVAVGAAKTYNGTGINDLTIRGNLEINANTTFSPGMTANILIGGNLVVTGTFNWNPTSGGTANRSLIFNSTVNGTQVVQGSGTYTVGANCRNWVVSNNAVVSLQRSISTFSIGDSIIVNPGCTLLLPAENTLSGTGSIFFNDTLSTLSIGSLSGITALGFAGNVQTGTRSFSKKAGYIYNGNDTQGTGTGLPDSVNKLFIQNPADVILSNPVTVTQQLGLDSGRLFSNSTNRLKLAATGIITSPVVNIYGSANQGSEAGFVSGPMTMETNTTDTITFPIGKKTGIVLRYAPVKLKPSTTTLKEYTAEYFPVPHSDVLNAEALLNRVSREEYWDISCNLSSPPANEAKVSLSWRPASYVGTGNPGDSLTAMQDLVVAHYFNDGFSTRWNMDGFMPTFTIRPNSNLSYGFITTDQFTGSFSPFTLASRSPFNILPLKLLAFSGNAAEDGIKLLWTTQAEQDIARYELQKTSGNGQFSTIFTTPSLNRLSTFSYGFLDKQPAPGWNYYRLKVVDNQQHSYFTHTIKVWAGAAGSVLVYPNPASSHVKIVLPPRSNSTITIVNYAGQVVKQVSTAESLLTINIESLSKGMYSVYIQTNRQAIVQRFVKQ